LEQGPDGLFCWDADSPYQSKESQSKRACLRLSKRCPARVKVQADKTVLSRVFYGSVSSIHLGHELLWLLKERISFCIRIKSNHISTNARGLEVSVDGLFYRLKPGEQRILRGSRKLWKQRVYLSALRLTNGELLIVATDKSVEDPIGLYAKRWEIETLFSCLKGREFRFEDTHITEMVRIEKLIALLTIAFDHCLLLGT
jgi:Transposase DDE domain